MKNKKSNSQLSEESRKLIKFSNYSLCVTLPKAVIQKLKWNKGDVVRMTVNENKGEILIRKGLRVPKKEEIEKAINNKSLAKTNKKTTKARW